MSERIRGSYDDALYKSTYTLLYFTLFSRSYLAYATLISTFYYYYYLLLRRRQTLSSSVYCSVSPDTLQPV